MTARHSPIQSQPSNTGHVKLALIQKGSTDIKMLSTVGTVTEHWQKSSVTERPRCVATEIEIAD